jgi:hypothetical protein
MTVAFRPDGCNQPCSEVLLVRRSMDVVTNRHRITIGWQVAPRQDNIWDSWHMRNMESEYGQNSVGESQVEEAP